MYLPSPNPVKLRMESTRLTVLRFVLTLTPFLPSSFLPLYFSLYLLSLPPLPLFLIFITCKF